MIAGSVDLAASDWHAVSSDAAFPFSQESTGNQASATQVPDSDHDESLEQLAQQQEQQYWSMLGIEDEPLVLPISSPRSMTPFAASKRARSRSPLVHDPQYLRDASETPLPSLPTLRSAQTRSCKSPTSVPAAGLDGRQWSPSMSPDPLLLQNATRTPSARRIKSTVNAVVADEGYQTRTDSDHVTILGETSFQLEGVQEIQEAMHVEHEENSAKSSDLDDLPPPLRTRTDTSTRKIHDRFLSSPLSSPTNSSEPLPSLTGRREEPSVPSVPTFTQDNVIRDADMPQRDTSAAPLSDTSVAPARQFRQRKAVQLAPYTTEFSKFASIATRNQWEGVVTAGLKQAFLDKEKSAADHADKRQRTASDDWLVHGNELEDEDDSAFSEPSSEPTSPRRKRRATLASDEDPMDPTHKASVERYSRSFKEKERDPIADRLKASRKSAEGHKAGLKHIRTSHASTSKVTIEDLDRNSSNKSKSRRPTGQHTASSRGHQQIVGATGFAQINKAKQAALLPSDVDSSSPDGQARAPRRVQRTSTPNVTSHHQRSQADATLVDSSSRTSSDSESESAPGSDSPDRPIVNRKDRFTLKGKRKRAAMFMMPAVALKRAEADLRLMEREMEEGKQIRLEEIDDRRAGDVIDESAKARKRWAPANAERPFRYVIDLSTGESESDSDAADSEMPADNDETQAAMKTWTTMAAGRTVSSKESRAQDSGYWDQIIGRILVRKGEEQRNKPRRRRKVKRADGQSRVKPAKREEPRSERRRSHKQSHLPQHFTQPVYLDSADRLYESMRSGTAAFRPRARVVTNRDAFWKELSASNLTDQGRTKAARDHEPVQSRPKSKEQLEENRDGDSSNFARFSFDYNIRPLPAGLSFAESTYLKKGCLLELLEEMRRTPCARLRSTPISPFGIGLDSTMEPDVLLQMLPRLVECIYEYTVGERLSTSLDCPIGQTLRFLYRYALLDIAQHPTAMAIRATIFDHFQALEARLEQYIVEVDALDHALSSSLLSFKWSMLELSILAYCRNQEAPQSAIKESSRHRILEMISEVASLLLRSSTATVSKEITRAAQDFQSRENTSSVESITCEAWVCLINICAQGATFKDFEFLSLPSLWRIIEHCLTEEAIEHKLHPIIRGETMACTCMTLCALSQFLPDGHCASEPQFKAHWPLITKSLDTIQPGDFAESYNTMSTANRTRTSRYIWTIYARCLTMASRWKWSLLEQGKMIGKMFDLLNSRQLKDFCIDGEADFPRFLSSFNGHIDLHIDSEDTTFQVFLRILAQTAAECQAQGDIKATNLLARIAMRIMPMREHLPYPRHASVGRPADRSILVNHCALLIVLAAIDPSTSDRRFAKLKTILDFASSDTRARQDYLKGIMFMGIVYKVMGMDLSPVLSWLTHTANYLCQTYSQCAKRRASLLALKRKSILAPKPNHQHAAKAGSRQGSTPAQEKDYDTEIMSINREMGEMAILEGLLLGAVQQVMLAKPQKIPTSPVYPPLEYLNDAWILQVLSSPMARDPVVGSQVLQCIQRFIILRNECMPQAQHPLQGESQDDFGDMDFDYNDPALNAMLGIADAQTEVDNQQEEFVNPALLDQRFIELVKTSISPQLYSILSDLSAASAGQESGVPDFPHGKAYIAGVVDLWATCAGILVQKGHREWKYYIEPFGKESWQRLADVVGRFEIGSMFVHTMLTVDVSSFKAHRAVLLEVMFRRLASPSPNTHDAMLLTRLLNADPAFLLWQNLPFHLEELLGEYLIDLEDYAKQRTAVFRAVFANCKKILEKGIIVHEEIERSCAAVCREQLIDDALVYQLLGYLMSSMRDFLDAISVDSSASASRKDYAAFCRQVVFLLKEELGPTHATEQTIPSLRLLAGVINGTVR